MSFYEVKGVRYAPWGPFGGLLQNFISIIIIPPNFRTTHPVATENSSRQIWAYFGRPAGWGGGLLVHHFDF